MKKSMDEYEMVLSMVWGHDALDNFLDFFPLSRRTRYV
jgi:hypothetical protein